MDKLMKIKMDGTEQSDSSATHRRTEALRIAIADELEHHRTPDPVRVNKLIDEEVLQISGLIRSEMIPGLQVVFMGVKLSTLDLERKAQGVLHVARCHLFPLW